MKRSSKADRFTQNAAVSILRLHAESGLRLDDIRKTKVQNLHATRAAVKAKGYTEDVKVWDRVIGVIGSATLRRLETIADGR